MKTYIVTEAIRCYSTYYVEAETPEEAKEKVEACDAGEGNFEIGDDSDIIYIHDEASGEMVWEGA